MNTEISPENQKGGHNDDRRQQWHGTSMNTENSDSTLTAKAMEKLCLFEELFEAHRSLCLQKLTGVKPSTKKTCERSACSESLLSSLGSNSNPKRNRKDVGLYTICAKHLRNSTTSTITLEEMASLRKSFSLIDDVDKHQKNEKTKNTVEDFRYQPEGNAMYPVLSSDDRRFSFHYDLECPNIRDSAVSAITLDDFSILEDLYNQSCHYSMDYSLPNLNARELDNVNEDEEYFSDLHGLDEDD
jgi:hypothetical protein